MALPPVVLGRRPIPVDGVWGPARSWFGGRPSLGAVPWPQDETGLPMEFAAQIHFGELAAADFPGLPASGAIAAFLGRMDSRGQAGCLRMVADKDLGRPTNPPADKPPVSAFLYDDDGEIVDADAKCFPYWPLDVHVVPKALGANQRELRSAALRQIGVDDTPSKNKAPQTVCWHSAMLYLADLRRMQDNAGRTLRFHDEETARNEGIMAELRANAAAETEELGAPSERVSKLIADMELYLARSRKARGERVDQIAALPGRIREIASWIGGHDAWSTMTDADRDRFRASVREDFRAFRLVSNRVHLWSDDYVRRTERTMATGGQRSRAALPPTVRARLSGPERLPGDGLHQMFGTGVAIQNASEMHGGKVMVLQLVYDMWMGWRFGDVGAFQFWLSPEDFRASRFDAAHVTFECS
ncbi:MAG: DUF1963 domain-containing protein [Pseudomonadota bacterium]